MKRNPLGAAFALVTLLTFTALCASQLTGCGPEKALPTVATKSDGGPVQQAAPTKSDPEAKATVDRAVNALTGGKPELLAKRGAYRYTLKGQMFSLDKGTQGQEANRTIAAVWPDKVFSMNERFPPEAKIVDEAWLRRPDLAVHTNGIPVPVTNPELFEPFIAADIVGQNWMPLLLPVTDPKAVVFDPQSVTLEKRSLRLVKLALGEYPVYQLTFDGSTDALIRVEYTNRYGNSPRLTAVIFSDHKPGPDGLVLPYRWECLHNKTTVEKWVVEKWEFPGTIKDDEFMPKKK